MKFHLHALFALFGLEEVPQREKRARLRSRRSRLALSARTSCARGRRNPPTGTFRAPAAVRHGPPMGLTGNWDGRISRRTLLRAAARRPRRTYCWAGRRWPRSGLPPLTGDPFSLGVASGDPTPGGMVLWTRLAPDPLAVDGGMPATPLGVRYEIALDERFRRVVRRGAIQATPDEVHPSTPRSTASGRTRRTGTASRPGRT